jgi:hypothetical protein
MPFQKNGVRNYEKEKDWDHKNGRLKDRAARNKARRSAISTGKASKGDGTHVDHKRALTAGGSTSLKNTRVVSASTNLKKEANRKKAEARKK